MKRRAAGPEHLTGITLLGSPAASSEQADELFEQHPSPAQDPR